MRIKRDGRQSMGHGFRSKFDGEAGDYSRFLADGDHETMEVGRIPVSNGNLINVDAVGSCLVDYRVNNRLKVFVEEMSRRSPSRGSVEIPEDVEHVG